MSDKDVKIYGSSQLQFCSGYTRKMHYLFSHMDRFPEKLGSMSDEQGERFHQDLKEMETRYQGRCDAVMMADYSWNLKRDLPAAEHSRSSKK